MNDKTTPVLGEKPKPVTYEFPWLEIRDFISVHITRKMAEQNMMIGEKLLEAGDPNATAEQVANVRAMHDQMERVEIELNRKIEAKLTANEGKGPRLIMPH